VFNEIDNSVSAHQAATCTGMQWTQ